jgi:hypothetical protein
MPSPHSVDDLEIVGYANVLSETMLPSVVPPVFRLKADPDRAFLPPYSFNAGFLCNATEVPASELDELRDAGEITLFGGVSPARREFELWVDQSFHWHYQSFDEARRELGRIASEAIKQATDALREGDLPRAERLAGVAISADDRRVEPLAIKAAVRRSRGNPLGERLMAELAARVAGEESFRILVDGYCAALPQSVPAAPRIDSKRPMHDVATIRPKAA